MQEAASAKDRLQLYKLRSELSLELQVRSEGGASLFAVKDGTSSGFQFQPDTAGFGWKVTKVELGLPVEDGTIRFGDFNGDGREGAVRWDPATMPYTVYLKEDDGEWKFLSTFGPWGKPGARLKLVVADFDGNGKSDLGLIDLSEGTLDVALSFQSK